MMHEENQAVLISKSLPNGEIVLRCQTADQPFNALCGFGARHNAKRGFLFVSKVLGKHWPCRPQAMLKVHQQLALKIQKPVDEFPILFIGFAETATGLAQGVFEQFLQLHGNGTAIYVQTTRYPLSDTEVLHFEEAHSHASRLMLHIPSNPELRQSFLRAQRLVLVDDELSTGNTYVNLVNAYRKLNPMLKEVSAVCITNFMGENRRAEFIQRLGDLTVEFIDILAGDFTFTAKSDYSLVLAPSAQQPMTCRKAFNGQFSARLGTSELVKIPSQHLEDLMADLGSARCILVVGCGEFMHPAWVLAQNLEARGLETYVQSTTRSPIMVAEDIQSCTALPDPYQEGIPNYIYNLEPLRNRYDRIIFCHECPDSEELLGVISALGAIPLAMGRVLERL